MIIAEITDGEIEAIVQEASRCVRNRLRRLVARKKESMLLHLLNGSTLSEAGRLRTYLNQTDYLPAEVDDDITVYARPYDYLVEKLHLTPANAKRLVRKLVAEDRVKTQVLGGDLHVVFPQATQKKSKRSGE